MVLYACAYMCMPCVHVVVCACVCTPSMFLRATLFPICQRTFENTELNSPSLANTVQVGLVMFLAHQGAVVTPLLRNPSARASLGPQATEQRSASAGCARRSLETGNGPPVSALARDPAQPPAGSVAEQSRDATSLRIKGASSFVDATFYRLLLIMSDVGAFTP